MKAKISNINLFVSDVAASSDFYTKVFGLEEIVDRAARPNFVRLRAGECVLSLQNAAPVGKEIKSESGGVEIGFEVDDVQAVAAALREQGGAIVELNEMAWGSAADALDPDGYQLTIFTRK